jgi:hypothetical protein
VFLKPLLFALGTACFAQVNAQNLLFGKVIDNSTRQQVPFANIVIMNASSGTAAGDNGKFVLSIATNQLMSKIRISSIGYVSSVHRIDSLLILKGEIVFQLVPEVKWIDEISVTDQRITPRDILVNAIKSLPKNYNQTSFNAEYYSTITTQNPTTAEPYKVETILFGHYEGYRSNAKRKFEIVHKRESGTNPIKDYLYWPALELFHADLLIHPEQHGIFNLKHIDKFELTLTDITTYDRDTIQIIDYVLPKPTKAVTGYGIVPKEYKGQLYITTSGALVKHVLNAPPFLFEIIYRKIDEHYYPFLVKGNRVYRNIFHINNTISLRQIELANVKPVAATQDDWDVSKIVFDENYWQANYPRGLND